MAETPKRVAIACQGGGSHAAFGAGVLHRLLQDVGERFQLAALSGTSGGAVNAALAWSGLIRGGPGEARRSLAGLWRDLAATEPLDAARNWWGQVLLGLPIAWEASPYIVDLDADDIMRRHFDSWIRLAEIPQARRLGEPQLFVGTTDILSGLACAIRGDGTLLTRKGRGPERPQADFDDDDLVASIAIPPLYKAVERRGGAFWDGLFSVNPPISVLTNLDPRPDEIWLIQINPQRLEKVPDTARAISDRRNELSGNVSLNKELDMIETINGLVRDGRISDPSYRPIDVRIVGLEETGLDLDSASKFDRRPDLLETLFRHGEELAPRFYEHRSDRVAYLARAMQMPAMR